MTGNETWTRGKIEQVFIYKIDEIKWQSNTGQSVLKSKGFYRTGGHFTGFVRLYFVFTAFYSVRFVSSYKVSLSGYIIKFPVLLVDHSILCPRCHQVFFQDSMKPLLLTRISLSLLRNTTKKFHTAIELHDNYSTEGPRRNAVHVLFLKSIIFLMTKIYILLLSKWYDAY